MTIEAKPKTKTPKVETREEREKKEKKKKKEKEKAKEAKTAKEKQFKDWSKAEFKLLGKSFEVGYKIGYGLAKFITDKLSKSKLDESAPLSAGNEKNTRSAGAHKLARQLRFEQPSAEEKNSGEGTEAGAPPAPAGAADENEAIIPPPIMQKLQSELLAAGMPAGNVEKLKPEDALRLLSIESDANDSKPEKIVTPDEIGKEYAVLQEILLHSYDAMEEVSTDEEVDEILDAVTKGGNDPDALEKYRSMMEGRLSPEQRYFIETAIEMKKFKGRAKEMLYGTESTG